VKVKGSPRNLSRNFEAITEEEMQADALHSGIFCVSMFYIFYMILPEKKQMSNTF
jgi:hypothetical protein